MLPTTQPKPSAGWTLIGRVKAAMLIFTALLAMVACVAIQPLLKTIATNQGVKVEGLASVYMQMPWIGLLLGIPSLIACVPLVRGTRRPLVWMTIATVLVLLPFAFLLVGFLGCVAPLYQYRGP